MTSYNSGNLIYQGSQVGSYPQPFNVDVIKIDPESALARNGGLWKVDRNYLQGSTPYNATYSGDEIIFNGSTTYLSISPSISIGLQDFTMEVSLRFLTANVGSDNNFGTFHNGGQFYWGIWLSNSNTVINTQFNLVGSADIRCSTAFNLGEYSFSASRKNGVLHLFINKVLLNTQPFAFNLGSINRFGGFPNGYYNLNGNLKYAAIYPSARYTSTYEKIYKFISWR